MGSICQNPNKKEQVNATEIDLQAVVQSQSLNDAFNMLGFDRG